jgi:hypothetical protein
MSGAQTATDGSDSAFTEVPELKEGFRLLYVQQYPEAREKFSVWTAEHPADPFGFVAEAASYLFEEFYRQGVMTSEFFMDDKKFLRGIEGKPEREELWRRVGANPQASQGASLKDNMSCSRLRDSGRRHGIEHDSIRRSASRPQENEGSQRNAKLRWLKRPGRMMPGSRRARRTISGASPGRSYGFVVWRYSGDKSSMELVEKTAERGRYLGHCESSSGAGSAARKTGPSWRRGSCTVLRNFESPLFAAEYAKVMGRPIPRS